MALGCSPPWEPHGMAQHGTALHGMAWQGTVWHSPAWLSPAPTCALQAPRQLGGEEDVHQLGAVVGSIEATRPLLPGEVAAVGSARTVPEGRDVDDTGGR